MSTRQPTQNGSSTVRSDNLVNANSREGVYIYRDGDQLAVESPRQTGEFSLDQLTWLCEGDIDVFDEVFAGAGEVHAFKWTFSGFDMMVYAGAERYTVHFIVGESR